MSLLLLRREISRPLQHPLREVLRLAWCVVLLSRTFKAT